MNLSKKTLAIIGGVAGLAGLGWLLTRVKAQPEILEVTVKSNPINTIILVDDQLEITTPTTLTLKPGIHKFSAVPKSPDLTVTYGFNYWQANGKAISYEPTIQVKITKSTVITAQYMIIASGRYPATLPI